MRSSGAAARVPSELQKLYLLVGHDVRGHRSGQEHDGCVSIHCTLCRPTCSRRSRGPSRAAAAGVVPSATFETLEGRYVIIGGNGDSIYTRLMTAVGRPDM